MKAKLKKFWTDLKEWCTVQKRDFNKNMNIVKQLVRKNIKVQYRNSVIGAVWTVLNPLLNMLVMYLVFSNIFPNAKNDPYYSLYLLCGNVMFNAMRAATTQSLPCIVNNRGLLTKNKISHNVFPLAANLSACVNFAFSFIALLGVMLVLQVNPAHPGVFSTNIFLTILVLPALFLFNYGLSLILSALYVFFRDIQHFYTVFLTLWTYITPIFYKIDNFGSETSIFTTSGLFKIVVNINPMYHFIEYFRDIIYRVQVGQALMPTAGDLLSLYLIGIGFLAVGAIVFMSTKNKFIYNI